MHTKTKRGHQPRDEEKMTPLLFRNQQVRGSSPRSGFVRSLGRTPGPAAPVVAVDREVGRGVGGDREGGEQRRQPLPRQGGGDAVVMHAKFRAAIRTVEEPLRRAHLSLGVARDRASDVTRGEVTTLLEDLASLKGGAP